MEEKKSRIILGIDISTACLGVSLVKYDEEGLHLIKISHVKPKVPKTIKGIESLFLKTKIFKEEFIEKYKTFGITDVVIEEPLPKSQNNNTVTTLLRFNGMISQEIYEALGVVPKYISSYDARKYAFPELMAVRRLNKHDVEYPLKKILHSIKKNELVLFGSYSFNCEKKYILWNKINEMIPEIEWEYNKNGELKTENFDASDSLVCVLGYINKEKYTEQPSITDFSVTELEKGDILIKYVVSFCGKNIDKTITLKGGEN